MKIQPQLQSYVPEISETSIPRTNDVPVEATGSNANMDRELHAVGPGVRDRHRVLRTSHIEQDSLIHKLVEEMLIPPAAGEVPEFKEDAWATMRDFDARRQGKENCATILGDETFQKVSDIAADSDNPCHADALLLMDIMTRPLGENPPSLESYLSTLVSKQVRATIGGSFVTTPKYDFTKYDDVRLFVRTDTSIMQGVALNSQDYTSTGRALILKGATHLLTRSDPPSRKPGGATDTSANGSLATRLQQAIFCFPTVPAEGRSKFELDVFDTYNYATGVIDPDPLETEFERKFGMQFYLNANSYQVLEAEKAASSSA